MYYYDTQFILARVLDTYLSVHLTHFTWNIASFPDIYSIPRVLVFILLIHGGAPNFYLIDYLIKTNIYNFKQCGDLNFNPL